MEKGIKVDFKSKKTRINSEKKCDKNINYIFFPLLLAVTKIIGNEDTYTNRSTSVRN